jgi:hypothetical protein
MKIVSLFLCLLLRPLFAIETFVVDMNSNTNVASVEVVKEFAESEFTDGNFGSASFLCEYLEKRNVDDPKFKLIWATAQSKIGNWNKAETLYLKVVHHNRASKRQKSLACVYISKQQTDTKAKEEYATLAVKYSADELVIDMVSQIYRDLEIDALSRSDAKKAEYYRTKYEEFIKNSTKRSQNEVGLETTRF